MMSELTSKQWQVVNEAVDWNDRKTLADVFQEAGGRVVDLSEGTYDGLLAVARWAAMRAVEDVGSATSRIEMP